MRPAVVFVHGMWSRPWVWDGWKRRFEDRGYACDAVTLPGHGDADDDRALAGLGLGDYTIAVLNVAQRFDRPVLVGHSMGGLIAQQVAAQMDASAVVLISSAAPAPIFPLRPVMLPGLVRHFARWDLWRKPFRLSRWEAGHLLLNALPESERDAYYGKLIAESGRIAYELGFGPFNLAGTNRVKRDAIASPMLAFAGVRDHVIPIAVSRRMAAWYGTRVEYREFPAHGHWMLGEPESSARADEALQWLETCGPS